MYKTPEKRRQAQRNSYAKNKRKYLDRQKLYRGRPEIQKELKEYQAGYRIANKEYSRKYRKEYSRRIKLQVLQHYSGMPTPQCDCCGESKLNFLTIDHINNDGFKHREIIGNGFYRKLINSNFATDSPLRVLCWNCNCGRRVNGGICPHKDPSIII